MYEEREQRTRRGNGAPSVMHGIGTIIHKDVAFALVDDDVEYEGHVDRVDFIARMAQIKTEDWSRWFPLEAFKWIEELS